MINSYKQCFFIGFIIYRQTFLETELNQNQVLRFSLEYTQTKHLFYIYIYTHNTHFVIGKTNILTFWGEGGQTYKLLD